MLVGSQLGVFFQTDLVTGVAAERVGVAPAALAGFDGGGGGDWISGPGGGAKRVRLNRNTSPDMAFWGFSLGHVHGGD